MSVYSAIEPGTAASSSFAGERESSGRSMAMWLMIAAVSFNFILAVANANVATMTSRHVILAEGLILLGAHFVIIRNYRAEFGIWYVLVWFMTAIAAARWMWLGHVDPKSLRDVLIIPTFIALGVMAGSSSLNRSVVWLQVAVLAVCLFELLAPDLYAPFANVKQYYINTRGFDDTAFWNEGSGFFVSATRPTERTFLPALGPHRASSIFLEPVSLGNYCILITAFVCARFSSLSARAIAFLVISNLVLLIGCDGRLAVTTSVLVILVSLVARRLPYMCLLFLPGAVMIAFLVHGVVGWKLGSDDFVGRIGLTAEFLQIMSLSDYMGVVEGRPGIMDSGLAYLISTQSIVGVVLLWLFLGLLIAERTYEQAAVKHATLLYLSLTMIVSYSFLTIKTAGLAWFVIGALQKAASIPPPRNASLPGDG